jgi:hypothetical protein
MGTARKQNQLRHSSYGISITLDKALKQPAGQVLTHKPAVLQLTTRRPGVAVQLQNRLSFKFQNVKKASSGNSGIK